MIEKPLKIAVFGDSIAEGLGARGKSWPQILCNNVRAELDDYTETGTCMRRALEKYALARTKPDIAFISHGVTDAIVRPDVQKLKWLPSRWRRLGWMDPRPYYSTSFQRRVLEKLESAVRWRVKNAFLLLPSMAMQLEPLDEYLDHLRALVDLLIADGVRVILVGPPPISNRFFPRSEAEQSRYFSYAKEIVRESVSLSGELQRWDDFLLDHFHPNESGHLKIAQVAERALKL